MLLELDNVKTYYGNIRALKGISIEVDEGEIVCLIGGNGAGKSTTLMTISGVLTPVEGDVRYQGRSIASVRPTSSRTSTSTAGTSSTSTTLRARGWGPSSSWITRPMSRPR